MICSAMQYYKESVNSMQFHYPAIYSRRYKNQHSVTFYFSDGSKLVYYSTMKQIAWFNKEGDMLSQACVK